MSTLPNPVEFPLNQAPRLCDAWRERQKAATDAAIPLGQVDGMTSLEGPAYPRTAGTTS